MKKDSHKINWSAKFPKEEIWTIPNILTFFRIALIPFIIWLYCIDQYFWALMLVLLSGLTDILDGIIARKFNMITELGKAIDPVADKLTQGIIIIALLTNFPLMWIPFGILILKEGIVLVLRYLAFRQTEYVASAEWHGKLNTIVLNCVMALHMIWFEIPFYISVITISIASVLMIISFILYTIDSVKVLQEIKKDKQ